MVVCKEVEDHRVVGVPLINKDQGRMVPEGEVQGPGGVGTRWLGSHDPLQDSFHQLIQVLQQMPDLGIPGWGEDWSGGTGQQ